MIDWLVYLFTGAFVGFVAAFIFSVFKVGPGKPEFNFFKALFVALCFTMVGPFAFVEAQTKLKKAELGSTVRNFFETESDLNGEFAAMKVLTCSGKAATVLLIANENQDWGGVDHPVSKLTLKKKPWKDKKGKRFEWQVIEEQVLRSDRLNKDQIVWPPYQ